MLKDGKLFFLKAYTCSNLFSVLCGDRLTQMTKTYNDVEAVTRLLEEVITYRVSMTRKCHDH